MNQAISHSACGAEPGLISVDQALQMILEQTHILVTESLPLAQALNRYLAEAIDSAIPLPLFSQSAVDGYALCSPENLRTHSTFELIGEIRAGQSTEIELRPAQAVRILPVPGFQQELQRSPVRKLSNTMSIKSLSQQT